MENRNGSKIILYTLPKCILCKEVKYQLQQSNIIFTEIDASADFLIALIDSVEEKYQTISYPIAEIKGNYLGDPYNYAIVLKSNLDTQKGLHILPDINQFIKQIKASAL